MLLLTVAIFGLLTQALAQTITAPAAAATTFAAAATTAAAAATTLAPGDCSDNTYVRPSSILPKLR
jgi:hypothetical protein